jgi:hypothetical protein
LPFSRVRFAYPSIRENEPAIRFLIHPAFPANHPDDTTWRAFCEGDTTSKPKALLACNRDILDETDIWIATPAMKKEMSGNWYTINYSRKQEKPRLIVYPNGSIGE